MLHGQLSWQFALEPARCDVSAAVRIEWASASDSLFAIRQTDLTWMHSESSNQVDPLH
jgi:hypothetical protein